MWLRRPKRSLTDFGFANVSGYADDPAVQAQAAQNADAYRTYVDTKKKDARRQFIQGGVTAAGVVGGPALAGLYTGAGAAGAAGGGAEAVGAAYPGAGLFGAPAAAVATGAPVAGAATSAAPGALATLGKVFSSKGAELGINAGLSLYGQHQQNKANDQARADALRAHREALALSRQQLEAEIRNADLDREDLRKANEAINELKRREFAASEEERAYVRSKDEAYEARMGPYRDISAKAMQKLSGMWGLG